jgi:hypothetical protein
MSTETPIVLLVHGAFADASSWNGVIERLQAKGWRSRRRAAGLEASALVGRPRHWR